MVLMVHISSQALTETQLKKLFVQLSHLISSSTPSNADILLDELLGYEERVLLAKRLATVVLLARGTTIYKTARTLKISTSTASKAQAQLDAGAYIHIQSLISKKNHGMLDLLETIDSILHLGGILPHYAGPDRRGQN